MKLIPLLVTIFLSTTYAADFWSAPDYGNQEASLGYHNQLFEVPESLRERVNFWIDIYTKYSTKNGIVHDGRYLEIKYQELDFSDILDSSVLSRWEKYRRQARRVRNAKRVIKRRLRYLHTIKDPTVLSGEDLRIWKLFESVNERNKFLKASYRNRLRFQLGQSDQIIKGIFFSGRYLKEMEEIFRKEGVPVQLTRLPFVESSFNIYARSKVGASGIWQFMRSTAKYRLRMNRSVDERNDAILSSRASARFLRRNFEMLKSWPLAITGYNHGPNGMRRLAKRYKTKDLATLIAKVTKRSFGFASKNFYACFLAIVHVESNADVYYGDDIPKDKPLYREEVKLPKQISWRGFLKYFGNSSKMARKYNPHIRRRTAYIGRRNRVFVPVGRRSELLQDLKKVKMKKKISKRPKKPQNIFEEFSSSLGLPPSVNSKQLIFRI